MRQKRNRQRTIFEVLGKSLGPQEFARSTGLIVHDINHLPRRKLGGNTSCIRFFNGPRVNYSKRKGKEVMLWIPDRAFDIVEKAGGDMTPDAA